MLFEWISQNRVLSTLSVNTRKSLAKQASIRRLKKGQILVLNGEVWPYLFLVGDGKLQALKESSEGRSLVVGSFVTSEIFWGLAFFDEESPMPVTLVAVENSTIYLWSREMLIPVFRTESEAAWRLCLRMIDRMKQVSMIVEEMAFQPVDRRLARLLIDHFTDSENDSMERHMTLDEMAAQIGTTREMVCRMLYRFSNNDLIHVTRTEFVLTDRDGLRLLAER
jgi:CRP/FNR family transcriptional regulator